MIHIATKHLWARRFSTIIPFINRLWPVRLTKWCINCMRSDTGECLWATFGTLAGGGLIGGLIAMTVHDSKRTDNAPSIDIRHSMSSDPCVAYNLPLQFKGVTRPITYGDLWYLEASCKKLVSDQAILADQAKAIESSPAN